MIYFIQAGENGPIKVGKSVNTENRLKTHQSSHYEELRVIQQIPGHSERENEIKKKLQKYNIRGEWFEPVPEVLEYIRNTKYPEYEVYEDRAFAILCRETETSKTETCPFCGKYHLHGYGDGHRVAHCASDDVEEQVFAEDGTKLLKNHGYIIKTRKKA